jgi:hypothetical protein
MKMFKNIETELKTIYKDSDFKVVEQNSNIEIFYNDEKLQDNEQFIDKVFEVCKKYLEEEDLWRIAVLYDYLRELPKSNYELVKETISISEIATLSSSIKYHSQLQFEKNFFFNTQQTENSIKKSKNILGTLLERVFNHTYIEKEPSKLIASSSQIDILPTFSRQCIF